MILAAANSIAMPLAHVVKLVYLANGGDKGHGQLAQWLERRFHIPKVTGSNPVLPTISYGIRRSGGWTKAEGDCSVLAES
jgi:hypothetical protein